MDRDGEPKLLSEISVKVDNLVAGYAQSVSVLKSVKLFLKQNFRLRLDLEVRHLSSNLTLAAVQVAHPGIELLACNLNSASSRGFFTESLSKRYNFLNEALVHLVGIF